MRRGVARARYVLRNASKSVLIWSVLVVHMPCGKPGYTFSLAFFTIFADISPAAPVVCDDSIALLTEEQHLRVPVQ